MGGGGGGTIVTYYFVETRKALQGHVVCNIIPVIKCSHKCREETNGKPLHLRIKYIFNFQCESRIDLKLLNLLVIVPFI